MIAARDHIWAERRYGSNSAVLALWPRRNRYERAQPRTRAAGDQPGAYEGTVGLSGSEPCLSIMSVPSWRPVCHLAERWTPDGRMSTVYRPDPAWAVPKESTMGEPSHVSCGRHAFTVDTPSAARVSFRPSPVGSRHPWFSSRNTICPLATQILNRTRSVPTTGTRKV